MKKLVLLIALIFLFSCTNKEQGYNSLEKGLISTLENKDEKEPEKTTVFYVTDPVQQSQYINMFKEQDMDAVILNHNIDSAFITQIEQQNQHIKFKRIDADVEDALKEDVDEKLNNLEL